MIVQQSANIKDRWALHEIPESGCGIPRAVDCDEEPLASMELAPQKNLRWTGRGDRLQGSFVGPVGGHGWPSGPGGNRGGSCSEPFRNHHRRVSRLSVGAFPQYFGTFIVNRLKEKTLIGPENSII